jgi:pyridoxal phosphate enzyme (YggS family)
MKPMTDIATNLTDIRARIDRAATAAGRGTGTVTLVAASKTVEAPGLESALAAGQRVFGENRVQEAQRKWPPLQARHPDMQLRLIGPLQTNKARDAVKLFDVIETIDRPRVAEAVAKACEQSGRSVGVLVQVNIGHESQKAGVAPEAADALIDLVRGLGLRLDGLMCIPPADVDPAPHFDRLREIARRHGLAVLSMGMSGDYETAIAHGATHVRVGTAIFGSRTLVQTG